MAEQISTRRLVLRPWRVEDAESALAIYGTADVSHWLSPVMDSVPDAAAMRLVLQQWTAEDARLISPAGRWAIERRDDRDLIGGAVLLPLPPDLVDIEMGWQLRPDAWRHGYATKLAGRWPAGRSVRASMRCLPCLGRPTPEPPLRPEGSVWNGSARLTSTTIYDFRSSAYGRATSLTMLAETHLRCRPAKPIASRTLAMMISEADASLQGCESAPRELSTRELSALRLERLKRGDS